MRLTPSSRPRRPQLRIEFDGFTVIRDTILEAVVKQQVMRNDGPTLPVGGIDLADLTQPGVGRAVSQYLNRRMNRHGVKGFGRELEGRVGLLSGCPWLRVLQREVGHQFVGLHQFGVQLQRLARPIQSLAIEALGADQSQAQVGWCILRIDLQGFVNRFSASELLKRSCIRRPQRTR